MNDSGDQTIAGRELTEQYEQLRRAATSWSEYGAERLGLALFLRRGMKAWMQARSPGTDRVTANAPCQPAITEAVPIDLRTQIAVLVAGIILGLQQERATL